MPQGGNVPYNPVATVSPSGGGDSGYIGSQATPGAFGGQVAQAEQGLGSSLEKVGAVGMDIATEQQGRINQSLADNAWTQHTTDVNDITAKYRSMEGLDAVQAHDATVAAITASRQKIAASLPNTASQMAFNTMARRQEAAALGEVSSYYATAVKQASLKSSNAVMQTATNQTGLLPVAQNDGQFAHSVTTATLSLNDQMTTQGYGAGMSVDPKTGVASWDTSTPDGKQAQAIYQQRYDTLQSQAWTNRIKTLADDPTSGNAQTALQVFNANKDKIPAQAQMELQAYLQPKLRTLDAHAAAGTALANADRGYQGVVSAAVSGGAKIGTDTIANAIHGQESGGAANAPTSINGAVGGWQIQPGTFATYAKPGEVIGSKADNEAVGRRIIADYTQKYNGDPARVAVAYFSGPGNVAPPGSATPYINDAKDGNGKSVSSYVSDVLGRVGGASGVVTKADYYKQHEAQIIEDARNEALARHPDDDAGADLAAARAAQQTGSVIRQQELSYSGDSDLVLRAANGDLSKGTGPLTVDQLRATSPEVAAAWDRMQYQQPAQAHEVATRLLTENSKHNGTDGNTYGAAYYDVFNRIHAPDGSPNRITDPSQLYSMVGNGLTMAGLTKAREEIMGRRTPDGDAEGKMRDQMFRNIHGVLTGTNDGLGIKDPQGEAIYLKFMTSAYQAIDKAKAAGKTPFQIYDPSSPDYVGKLAAGMKRSPAQYQSDMNSAYVDAAQTAKTPQVRASLADIQAEMQRRGLFKTAANLPPAQVDNGPEAPHGEAPEGDEDAVFPRQPVSDDDIAFAQKSGMSYGTGNESFEAEKEGKDFSGENYTATDILARKSAIMGLGFDPRVHDIGDVDQSISDTGGEVEGEYSPETGRVSTGGTPSKHDFNPTVLAHEFGHRGLAELRKDYPDNSDLKFFGDHDNEEALVRYLHHKVTNTPITSWEMDQWPIMGNKHFPDMVQDIEDLASQSIAKRHPGGPR